MCLITPCSLGQLPDPVKCQGHLRELTGMMDDEKMREELLGALQLESSCEEVTKAKVEGRERVCV